MPMNEYGEIVRSSSTYAAQTASSNNNSSSGGNSGCAILIGIAILLGTLLFIVSAASVRNNKTYGSAESNDPGYSQNTTTPDEQNSSSSGYILPHSNSEYITFSDLEDLSKQEVILARNEIFARRGRKFDTEYIQEYFDAQSWYNPIYDPDDFPVSIINEYEKKNVNTIVEYEKAQGWR